MRRLFLFLFLNVLPFYAWADNLAIIENGKWAWPIVEVVDGDTIRLLVPNLPSAVQYFSIRIKGVDTPELPPKAKCVEEASLALQARQFTWNFLKQGPIHIEALKPDKYGNRWLGDVFAKNENLSEALLKAGLAQPYKGDKRQGWCG